MTRIERPKERDIGKELMDRPVKDEIEVVHLRDGSRSSGRRPFHHPLSSTRAGESNNFPHLATVSDKTTTSDQGRINGYSNGYGSASDVEMNDDLLDEDDEMDGEPSDEADDGNLSDLPMPPSPPVKVSNDYQTESINHLLG